MKNAIGTLDICGKLLFISDYGGAVIIYSMKNISPAEPAPKEDNSLLRLEKGGSTSREEALTKMKEWRAQKRQQEEKETQNNNNGYIRSNDKYQAEKNQGERSNLYDKYSATSTRTQTSGNGGENSQSSLSSALRDANRKRTDSAMSSGNNYSAGGGYGRR